MLEEVVLLISGLPFDDLYRKASEIQEILDSVEVTIRNVQLETGLRCPPSCRECCKTSGDVIQVTVTEFLPLSLRLWNEGKANQLLERLDSVYDSDQCILFESSSAISEEGGCTEYSSRPLLCRLFGFSGIINRLGQVTPVVCKHMKKHCPLSVKNLFGKLSCGLEIPVFADYSSQIRGIDPYMGANTFSVNLALRRALEYVGLRFDFTGRGYDRTA